jgi:hypothetical protein
MGLLDEAAVSETLRHEEQEVENEDQSEPDLGGLFVRASKYSGEQSETASFGQTLLVTLRAAREQFGSLKGLALETVQTFDHVASMIGHFTAVSEIGADRCLILGGSSLDCGLLAHRLNASLESKTLAEFTAETPEEALRILEPCL